MSTVAEKTVAEQVQEEHAASQFVMPTLLQGETVLWYRYGTKSALLPELAIALKINKRSIRIKTLVGERILEGCRHLNDPRLQQGPDLREDGAWDFGPNNLLIKRLTAEVAELKARLDMKPSDVKSVPTPIKRS